jgi:hypothetical protein
MSEYDVESLPHDIGPLPSSPVSGGPLAGADAADEFDPELAALPAPSRRGRTTTLALLALAVVAAVAMAASLRREVAYAFAGDSPTTLGDLRSVADTTLRASENRLVRAEAMLGAAGGIRYERPLRDETFRAVPVVGRPDVWVEVQVPPGQENGRWEPPRTLTGRLVRMDVAGLRHRELRQAIEEATHTPVPAGSWLLADGEEPSNARWSVVVALTFLAFAVWNASAIARLVRRVS